MALVQDSQISLAAETTYKTYAAPTRSVEYNDESLQWNPVKKQGKGLRVNSRLSRKDRRVITMADGGGDFSLDVVSKGLGVLLQTAMGATATVTQIATTGAYVQIHTFGDNPGSLTIQKSTVQAISGTLDTHTFLGAMVDSFEINSPNGEFVNAKFTLDIADFNTSQGYVNTSSAPYAGGNPFNWGQATMKVGGAVTLASGATLASSTGAATLNVRDFSIQVNNDLAKDRFTYAGNVGGQGRKAKPTVGNRSVTGKFTVDYDQVTLRDAALADTDLALLIDFQGAAISSSFERLQIVLPVTRIDSDPLPNTNGGDLITQDFSFTVLETTPGTAPIQIIYVSTDTAV